MNISARDMTFLRDLLYERTGNALSDDKDYLVNARLGSLCRDENFGSISELIKRVRASSGGPMEERVLELLLITETSFFRHPHSFEILRDLVLPEMVAMRTNEQRLRIWCAASSTGQEAFSVGMVIREQFPELLRWKVRIEATDFCNAALEKAEMGMYSQLEVNRGLPARLLVRFFNMHGIRWGVNDDLRRLVQFRRLNLMQATPLAPRVDIIFLRNVLIYMDEVARKQVLALVAQTLAPGGFLFLGPVENAFNLSPAFDRISCGRSTCYRLALQGKDSLQFAEAQMIEVTKRAWSLMLNLEIKKYGTNDVTIGDDWVNAAVGTSGSWRGSVSLLCPPVLARRWAALMFATAEDALTQVDIDDATGEMANVLAGNLKVVWPGDSRLFPPEITLGPGNGPAKNSEITTVLAFEDMQLPFVVMMQKFHSSVGEAGG